MLYRSLVDRQPRDLKTGATAVGSLLLPTNDAEFLVSLLWIEGIRGDDVTPGTIETIRRHIQAKLRGVASSPNAAPGLQALNRRVGADIFVQ